ncbi:uncharacterized protein METZ01_LOCUS166297 [marine metagenome]|uniref:4-hydroxythreonine-4-phosphate dehydrogenase n=1 Tax=marine metagenome TaxID=408172 RepID=A0A382BJX0_9ZZZZ|tara:strand:+ start:66 stop:1118 length:1053 start_codon:yes stop_codon:yes gene_type:complete
MQENKMLKIGITIGDMNGVGPEIILKTFADKRMLEFCTPIIYSSTRTLEFVKKHFKYNIEFNGIKSSAQAEDNRVNVVNCWNEVPQINFGTKDKNIGKHAIISLKAATSDLKQGHVDVIVTAPINKDSIQSDDFNFPGHTDYLDNQIEGSALMLMVSGNLRIGLLTDHIPVSKISESITKELVENKINTIHKTLVEDFNISKPKIAILGINPHSGDDGVIGSEEKTVLTPTVERMRENNILAFGPYSADSFFGSGEHEPFDAVIAAYHDQGLIPFKTLSFGQGVNFTAGLEKIRTSPDHGTAYSIAGKGIADETSFKEAVFLAILTYRNRTEHQELIKGAIKEENLTKTK